MKALIDLTIPWEKTQTSSGLLIGPLNGEPLACIQAQPGTPLHTILSASPEAFMALEIAMKYLNDIENKIPKGSVAEVAHAGTRSVVRNALFNGGYTFAE